MVYMSMPDREAAMNKVVGAALASRCLAGRPAPISRAPA